MVGLKLAIGFPDTLAGSLSSIVVDLYWVCKVSRGHEPHLVQSPPSPGPYVPREARTAGFRGCPVAIGRARL